MILPLVTIFLIVLLRDYIFNLYVYTLLVFALLVHIRVYILDKYEKLFNNIDLAVKITVNLTATINGIMMIISPILFYVIGVKCIIIANLCHLFLDLPIVNWSFTFHHIVVIICDFMILGAEIDEQYKALILYSLIEISNIFLWLNYHRVKLGDKLSLGDLVVELLWFLLFRSAAFVLSLKYAILYEFYSGFIACIIICSMSVLWAIGLVKKIQNL